MTEKLGLAAVRSAPRVQTPAVQNVIRPAPKRSTRTPPTRMRTGRRVGGAVVASFIAGSGAGGACALLARPLERGEEEAVGAVAVRVELDPAGGRAGPARGDPLRPEERRERHGTEAGLALGEVRDVLVLGPADGAG